jgi:hypothetical protein
MLPVTGRHGRRPWILLWANERPPALFQKHQLKATWARQWLVRQAYGRL